MEKSKRYHEKKHEIIVTNHKFHYEDKGSNFSQTQTKNGMNNNNIFERQNRKNENTNIEINKENISFHKNKNYFYSSINLKSIPATNKPLYNNNNLNHNEIPKYNKIQIHKRKYQRYNSVAYIKKRPNDLMRIQNYENNSVIYNKFLQTTLKTKGRCLSCTNIKKNYDLLNNNIISNFDIDNNNSSKKSLIPLSYSLIPKNDIKNDRNVNNFAVKRQKNIMNKKLGINFCKNIFNVIKKHLLSNKIVFFKKIKNTKKNLMYEVSLEEYKFLEELKGLGVTNKKELNILLKDIYISIKGNNKELNDSQEKK
jgi:hypothetical protein